MTDTVVTVEDEQPVGAVEPQVDILVDRQDAPVVIDTAVTQVVTQEAQTSIVVPRPEIHIVAVGQAGPPGGGSSDHGALTGLADDDHTQYHNDARGDLRYDAIGAAAAAVSAHEAAGDPHPGYLTPAEGNAAYDAIGAAATVQSNLNTHKTSADHDGRYYTEAEADALLATKAAAGANTDITELLLDVAGLKIKDTDGSHSMAVAAGSNLTANRTLTFTTGDADRTITLSGSPTLADWFDQSAKQAASPTFAGLNITGNTTLGDASSDTLTINAGVWTIGSNFIATRAAGTLAAGTVDLGVFAATYTADAGGTTVARPWQFKATAQGANDFLRTNALTQTIEHAGTGTVGAARSINNILRLSSSGDVTLARGVESIINITGSGSVVRADMFLSQEPDLSGTGTIDELNGFRALNLGNSLVTDAAGFRCLDMSGSTTMSAFIGEMSSGSGKKNLNITGTAENVIAGNVRIGSTTSPTVALDVTGDASVSGNTTLGDASGDTLTINAGTWTYGNNITAARAGGTLGTGEQRLFNYEASCTGDSGGGTNVRGVRNYLEGQGSNAFAVLNSMLYIAAHNGSATAVAVRGVEGQGRLLSSGDALLLTAFAGFLDVRSTGSVTIGDIFLAAPPSLTGTGTIAELNGLRAQNANTALVTDFNGVLVEDQTSATGEMSGIRLELSAGTSKKNLNITGTADNALAGPLYLAQDTKAQQTASAIYAGTGAPNNANGNNGDFYFRGDGTVAGNTVMYHKEAGAWVAFTTT